MKAAVLTGVFAGFLVAGFAFEASALSLVKTQKQCTRYGGSVSKSNEDPAYPYSCETPARDEACVIEHGEEYYFDAEFGECLDMDCMEMLENDAEACGPLF